MLDTAFFVYLILVAVEFLFWVRPTSEVWRRIKARAYSKPGFAYLCPLEYVIRLVLLFSLLKILGVWGSRVTLLTVFGETLFGVAASLGIGIALSWAVLAQAFGWRIPWKQVLSALKTVPTANHLYGLLWVAGVEEFIFRGVLIGLLRPEVGLWALPLSALVMMMWHIPVWYTYAACPDKYGLSAGSGAARAVAGLAVSGTAFSLVLGALFYATGSILGPVLVHFTSNSAYSVARRIARPSSAVRRRSLQIPGRR